MTDPYQPPPGPPQTGGYPMPQQPYYDNPKYGHQPYYDRPQMPSQYPPRAPSKLLQQLHKCKRNSIA